jgi:AAA domain-containing protein
MPGFRDKNKEAWEKIAGGWHRSLKDLPKSHFERLTATQTNKEFKRNKLALQINYFHLNDKPMLRPDGLQISRVRMHDPNDLKNRYCGRDGDPVAVYIPGGLKVLLKKSKKPLHAVEGEAKADYLVRLGVPAFGYQGVSAWQAQGAPALGFDELAPYIKGRKVILDLDSDVTIPSPKKAQSRKWVKKLGRYLETLEPASVGFRPLPTLEINAANIEKSKTGVDDLLAFYGDDLRELDALAVLPLDDPQFKDWDTASGGLPESLLNPRPLPPEWLTEDAPPIDWVVRGLIAMDETTILNAQAGAGKTALLIRLMQGVATGRSVLNFTITRPRRVLYAMLERTPDSLQRRVRRAFLDITVDAALAKYLDPQHGAGNAIMRENFRPVPLAGETLNLISFREQQWLPNYETIAQLVEMIKRVGIEVIVFDTLSRLHGGSSLDPALASALCKTCEKTALETHTAIVLVSHGNKERRDDMYGVSGSGVWVNNTSNMIQLHEVQPSDLVGATFLGAQPEPGDTIIELNHYRMSDAPRYPRQWYVIAKAEGSMRSLGVHFATTQERLTAQVETITGEDCQICGWFTKLGQRPFSKSECIEALRKLLNCGRPTAIEAFKQMQTTGTVKLHLKRDPTIKGRSSFVVSAAAMSAAKPIAEPPTGSIKKPRKVRRAK